MYAVFSHTGHFTLKSQKYKDRDGGQEIRICPLVYGWAIMFGLRPDGTISSSPLIREH